MDYASSPNTDRDGKCCDWASIYVDLLDNNNPFTAHATIQFKISAPGKVSIKIVNSEGRVVSTVFEGDRPAGTYHLSFNRNQLAAGLYVCRVQINDQFLQQKIIVQR